jgi:CubicO group peptidase (beta-lactamase class C family)
MCASIESSSAQPVIGTAPAKPLDPKELDGYFAGQLSRKPFVGISVAVVQGGKITFCKGYGYASKETNRQVDNETRFAVASVTKEFTAAGFAPRLLIPLGHRPFRAVTRVRIPLGSFRKTP